MTPDLGKFGAWFNPAHDDESRTKYVVEAETLGYGTAWLGVGINPVADLTAVERMLDATSTIVVATAIVNMWVDDAETVARSYRRISAKHGDRFLLGVGIGHPEAVKSYQKPYDKMVDYLDRLDDGGVPRDNRVLAALGPRALKLAAARTAGSHPYLTVPEHTRAARAALGQDSLLAPEQTVVVESDVDSARATAREFLRTYLGLTNYVSNLRRHGFGEDDVAAPGSDHLVDTLIPHGTPETVAGALTAHLDAGADHVGVQILTDGNADPMPGYRALATALFPPK
jgi:probable F420-dependent oxidoreductase